MTGSELNATQASRALARGALHLRGANLLRALHSQGTTDHPCRCCPRGGQDVLIPEPSHEQRSRPAHRLNHRDTGNVLCEPYAQHLLSPGAGEVSGGQLHISSALLLGSTRAPETSPGLALQPPSAGQQLPQVRRSCLRSQSLLPGNDSSRHHPEFVSTLDSRFQHRC